MAPRFALYVAFALLSSTLFAQQPAFEVASIRPSAPTASGVPIRIGGLVGGPGTKDPTRVSGTRVPLQVLVRTAYELPRLVLPEPTISSSILMSS